MTEKDERDTVEGVADRKANERLKHTVELEAGEKGATTTRDDAADSGVPMLQGHPSEPQGPEDAFGPGPKRGDYSERTGGVRSVSMEPNPKAGEAITDSDGNVVDYEPNSIMVNQTARASQQGEVEGEKGGVTTVD